MMTTGYTYDIPEGKADAQTYLLRFVTASMGEGNTIPAPKQTKAKYIAQETTYWRSAHSKAAKALDKLQNMNKPAKAAAYRAAQDDQVDKMVDSTIEREEAMANYGIVLRELEALEVPFVLEGLKASALSHLREEIRYHKDKDLLPATRTHEIASEPDTVGAVEDWYLEQLKYALNRVVQAKTDLVKYTAKAKKRFEIIEAARKRFPEVVL